MVESRLKPEVAADIADPRIPRKTGPGASGERRRLPDFLVVGPSRTGTTWLHEVLAFGADLPANVKETQFFTSQYHKGIDWYAWQFRNARGDRPVGEVCPYFNPPAARKRIKLHLPDCRIICTLRDPVDRVYSHYKMLLCNGWMRGSFVHNVQTLARMQNMNRYATNLADWFELFGRDRVLVLFYEDLQRNRQEYINRICEFIGIAPIELARLDFPRRSINSFERAPRSRHLAKHASRFREFLRRHDLYRINHLLEGSGLWEFCSGGGAKFAPLTPEDDARVRAVYVAEVEALEKLLDRDLTEWKKPHRVRRDDSADSKARLGSSGTVRAG